MDFAKLVGDTAPTPEAEEAFDIEPQRDDGTPFSNGADEPLKMSVHPFNGARFQNAARRLMVMGKVDTDEKPPEEMTEEDIEAKVQQIAEREVDLPAYLVESWNLVNGGEAVPCTLDNRVALLRAAPKLRAAVSALMVERGNAKPTRKRK